MTGASPWPFGVASALLVAGVADEVAAVTTLVAGGSAEVRTARNRT